MDLLLVLDVGTTATKAVLFDLSGAIVASATYAYGLITPHAAEVAEKRIAGGREMMKRIDELMTNGNYQGELTLLKPEIDRLNALPVTEKRELALPVGLIKLKFWRALWYLMTKR